MGVPVPVPWVLSFPIPSINGTRPRLQYERSRNLSFTKAIIQIILVAGLLCPYNHFHVVVIQRNYTTLYRLCNNFILILKRISKRTTRPGKLCTRGKDYSFVFPSQPYHVLLQCTSGSHVLHQFQLSTHIDQSIRGNST